jgi:DNA-directed RNA polymerase specialized sigma24 family protein
MDAPDPDLTRLLNRIGSGDDEAWGLALTRIYDVLKERAQGLMKDQAEGHTLQTTALVHEAFIKLIGGNVAWETRRHFERVAIRAMRQVLVDHARARNAGQAHRWTRARVPER